MRNPNPEISVVIPAYNEEKYISRSLESLFSQSFKNFEVIVVDNNCTDRTSQIALKFGARIVREKIQGMTPAREKGFLKAHAPIIAKLDADSIASNNWLEKIYRHMHAHPEISGICGNLKMYTSSGRNISFMTKVFILYIYLSRLLLGHYPLVGPNCAIRKSAWKKITVHSDDRLVHEDIDLSCHLSTAGRIAFDKSLVVSTSLRRWEKNLPVMLLEYTARYIKTIFIHSNFYDIHLRIKSHMQDSREIIRKLKKYSKFFDTGLYRNRK